MANLSRPSIIWAVPIDWQHSAVTTTIRLLSTLCGRHASIVRTEDCPQESDYPIIHYSETEVPRAVRIPIDTEFWHTFTETGCVSQPRLTVEWQQSTLPVWSQFVADIPVDTIAASFYHYARLEERNASKLDNHGRFRAQDSWLVSHGLVERPVIHEYAAGLGRRLGLRNHPVACWPGDHSFAVAFTHDIDRIQMHGRVSMEARAIGASILRGDGWDTVRRRLLDRRAVRRGQSPDPYDTVARIAKYHQAHEFGATFFWIATEPSARDADYWPGSPNVADTIRTHSTPPFECGLHGSYDSHLDADMLHTQKAKLEQASGTPVRATRQHYLRFKLEDTWKAQRNAGLDVDSTLGFAERIGFRSGLAVPFQPWSFADNRPFDLWEVPLVMMDVTLKEYMHLSPDAALERSQKMIEALQLLGAGAALLWHNSALNDVDWPGWDCVYDLWLKETRRLGGWGTSVSTLADRWAAYVHDLGNDAQG